jgi:phosphoesterase RecJ-like protein
MGNDDFQGILPLIKGAQSALILTHERPDGDAVGSLLAFTLALEQWEIAATPVISDGNPSHFRFLPGAERITTRPAGEADIVVVVDCSDLERTGLTAADLPRKPDLNIDHHPTNTSFAGMNIVRPHAASTTEILSELFPALGFEITPEIASNLLTGLITDTVGFSTSSVTPEVFELAAALSREGAPAAHLYDLALNRKTFTSFRYWGKGLSQLQQDGDLVWTTLTLDDRNSVGYPGTDDADLVNILQRIEGARVAVIFVEQPGERVKISWRSDSDVNVATVASSFGGGGHEQAAGAMLTGKLGEVQSRVIKATKEVLASTPEMP